ncbi:type VII secretion-associated serine protease mycosin [Actinophytocola sediminis]
MTRRSITARLVAAALLTVLVPAAPLASAQPAEDTGAGPTPPPLGGDRSVPDDNGKPDKEYTQVTDKTCVTSLDGPVELQDKAWGQDVLRFQDLSQFATGDGQTVAVIDTGVNAHDFLGNRLVSGGDYVQDGGDGLSDCDGHGTQVAGIIAAKAPANFGFQGIAPNAKILSIRQSSEFFEFKPPEGSQEPPRERAGSLVTLAKAVVSAANQGVDVINMSVDTCRAADDARINGPIRSDERELQRALRYAVEDKDVVVVSSAGNVPGPDCKDQNNADPDNPKFIVTPPWFSEYVLSVAAVDQAGDAADFSMHGPWVSVAAPGTDIISLNPGDRDSLVNVTASANGQASPIQGTSFAAPYVAGLAALVRERFEKLGTPLTAQQVMERIRATAAHPGAPGGHNIEIGYGMIDPVAALTTTIPGEGGVVPKDKAIDIPFEMPPPYEKDWAPMQVAIVGSAGGLGLLLLTLFIVHTVRRQRRDPADQL